MDTHEISPIAYMKSDFTSKFGIPRQSGLTPSNISEIHILPEYSDMNAFRGLDGYDYLWLIWDFSEIPDGKWSPMVKPPRLGGNTRMGVFSTRSPNRPNHLGLSCVRLHQVEYRKGHGIVIKVSGADLMDGTPIYDIKPYLPYADSHPCARGGFAHEHLSDTLSVVFPGELLERIPSEKQSGLLEALRQDPRPSYQNDSGIPYGFPFGGLEIRFHVEGDTLTVFDVIASEDACNVK